MIHKCFVYFHCGNFIRQSVSQSVYSHMTKTTTVIEKLHKIGHVRHASSEIIFWSCIWWTCHSTRIIFIRRIRYSLSFYFFFWSSYYYMPFLFFVVNPTTVLLNQSKTRIYTHTHTHIIDTEFIIPVNMEFLFCQFDRNDSFAKVSHLLRGNCSKRARAKTWAHGARLVVWCVVQTPSVE